MIGYPTSTMVGSKAVTGDPTYLHNDWLDSGACQSYLNCDWLVPDHSVVSQILNRKKTENALLSKIDL
jgi:hypothetical protein